MDILGILVGIISVIALFAALGAEAEVKSPEPGNPKLPTVSQSRKIPLAVGRTMVSGPNVIEATKFVTYNNKEEGINYYQNLEFAVAYGPGRLYSIWSSDRLVWEPSEGDLEEDGDTVFIAKINLFGSAKTPGEGGMRGDITFCKGSASGYNFPGWDVLTGRDQPGYPLLSRVLFSWGAGSNNRGFYWGNSANYRPLEFEYGFFPNPLNHVSNHIVGNGTEEAANPAYVLYEILKSPSYGTSSAATVDTTALAEMAVTLHTEGIGIRRTWYTESAMEIEEEILALVDGVRYRDPATGFIVYKLLRDDYSGIPTVTDSEIVDMSVAANSMSSVPNKISITYLDGDSHYKEKKLTETNIASRLATGYDIQKDLSFLGAGNATSAGRLLTRTVRKESKPRRSGKIVLNRIAWDWSRGDTFIINSEREGIVSLPVRINEHKRNDIGDRQITIDFIEEVFVSGGAIFDTPITGIDDNDVAAGVITDFTAIPLPRHLYRSGIAGYDAAKFGVLASDPVVSSSAFYIEMASGVWVRGAAQSFASPLTPTGSFVYNEDTLSAQGVIFSDTAMGAGVIDTFKNVLLVVRSSTEYEFICYRSSSYDNVTGITTFATCSRGLYGPQPLAIVATDKFYQLKDLALIDTPLAAGYSNQSYRLVDETGLGEEVTATQTVDSEERSVAPQAPGYFGITGNPTPGARTGGFTFTFASRNYETAQLIGMQAWTSNVAESLGANESITIQCWDKTNNTLLLDYTDAYTTEVTQGFRLVGLTTELEFLGTTYDSGTGLISPDTSVCVFDYSAIAESLWYATEGGTQVMYDSNGKQATGLDTATGLGSGAAVNTYPLPAGKYYFEVHVTTLAGTTQPAIGVIDETQKSTANFSGSLMAVQTPAASNWGGSGNVGGFVNGSRICVAVDTATREVWIRKNGDVWAGGGDPTLGTLPYKTLTGLGALLPYADVRSGASVNGRFASGHSYTRPSGFAVWG